MVKNNKKFITILVLIFIITGCRTPDVLPQGNNAALIEYLNKRVPQLLKRDGVPGAAIALVDQGEVVWAEGYRTAIKDRNVIVAADTPFNVGSISQSVSAWGFLTLVEDGLVDLDAPIETYLSRWHLPETDYDHNQITFENLLRHRAGLSLHGYPGFNVGQPVPSLEESLSGETNGGGSVEVISEPGRTFRFSGGGYSLMQLALEEVTGENFNDYMAEEVLAPLGMDNSTFDPDPNLVPNRGYGRYGQSLPGTVYTAKAATGLSTSAIDLGRFVGAFMLGSDISQVGRGVISEEMVQQVCQGEVFGYGVIPADTKVGLLCSIGGVSPGYRAWVGVLPEQSKGIVILVNSERGNMMIADLVRDWGAWVGAGEIADFQDFIQINQIANWITGILLVLTIWRGVRMWGQIQVGKRVRRNRITVRMGVQTAFILVFWGMITPYLGIFAPVGSILIAVGVITWVGMGVVGGFFPAVLKQN